jgi:hypothetical protein
MSHKWTEGEIRRIVEDENREAAFEVLKYLCERGPRVIAFGDMSDPEREALETDDECDSCGAPPGEYCRPGCAP